MKGALQFHSDQHKLDEEGRNGTSNEFQRLFAEEMADFFHLSLCLTADAEMAERCLILAMRECISSDCVMSQGWARTWARRAVIRHAISSVLGTENAPQYEIQCETGFDLPPQFNEDRTEALRESPAIFELPNLERLVFVICIVERYSILECALLLGRSPKVVTAARIRAINQIDAAATVVNPATEACIGGDSPGNCQFGNSGRNSVRGAALRRL